jgi:hypothetical protein
VKSFREISYSPDENVHVQTAALRKCRRAGDQDVRPEPLRALVLAFVELAACGCLCFWFILPLYFYPEPIDAAPACGALLCEAAALGGEG